MHSWRSELFRCLLSDRCSPWRWFYCRAAVDRLSLLRSPGDFAAFDQNPVPPATPDWSPVRSFGGYAGWGEQAILQQKAAQACSCAQSCGVHGHDHATAWSSRLPISDLKSFWGAFGCACWAV